MKYSFLICLLLLFLLVFFRVIAYFSFPPALSNGQEIVFATRLLNEPSSSASSTSFHAFYQQGWSAQDVLVITQPQDDLHYGSLILISGRINHEMLNNNQVSLVMRSPVIKAVSQPTNLFYDATYTLRQRIINFFVSNLDAISSGLLLGIVFGIKTAMSKNFLVDMQTVGITHIIAASGMNVTMVAGFLSATLEFVLPRKPGILVVIISILFYCLLSGLQPSIVRATWMVSMVLASQLWGKQYTAWYALLMTAAFMLIFSPQLLVDVGFQLSFFSTLGILFIQPLTPQNILSEDIATTIAAQTATLPILLIHFGQYSILSILVNALVLWTIPPLMILGGVGVLIGFFLPVVGRLFLLLAIPLLWYFETVAQWFAHWHWVVSISSLPVACFVGYYCLLGGVVLFLHKKQQEKKSFPLQIPLDNKENL